MKLAFAVGGRTDTALTVKDYTFQQLAARLRSPKQGGKDGSYYIRGGDLVAPKRADENLRTAELLILDGDSRIDPETGEIISGAPPMLEVGAALRDMNIAYIAHTSHSYRPVNGGGQPHWKYRIVIPARLKSQKELEACVQWTLAQLHARGVWLADVTENSKWSQPWYLPRVEQPDAFLADVNEDGHAFPVSEAMAWAKERQKREQVEQSIVSNPVNQSSGDIDTFNKAHSLEWVRSKLESQGYKFVFKDGDKFRYIRPGSESGTPGVVVFRGARGDWCVFSHHGAADPLSNKVSDPFDLVAIFDHNGDRKAAARAVLPKQPNISEQLGILSGQQPDKADQNPIKSLEPSQPEQPKKRVSLIMANELRDEPITWLIDQLVPAKGFAALYGKPGSYKSFVALYLAAMISTGQEAFGRDTIQGDVIYVAGEGGAGLKRRWDAVKRHYSLPNDARIAFVKSQLNLRSTLEDLEALVEAINERKLKPSLIIIDTLARAFAGGNENSSEDMGAFIAVMGAMQARLDSAVMIVHHSGKDEARGQRGHSSLLGAVDAELEVVKISEEDSQERVGKLTVTKQKDGEDGFEIGYEMVTIPLSAIDPEATSLAVQPMDKVVEARRKADPNKLAPGQKLVFDALKLAIEEAGETVGLDRIPPQKRCVKVSLWREYYYRMSPHSDAAKKKAFMRAKTEMLARGTFGCWAEWCWITEG